MDGRTGAISIRVNGGTRTGTTPTKQKTNNRPQTMTARNHRKLPTENPNSANATDGETATPRGRRKWGNLTPIRTRRHPPPKGIQERLIQTPRLNLKPQGDLRPNKVKTNKVPNTIHKLEKNLTSTAAYPKCPLN